uniref:Transglycosylase SLT domain-containing protein n=1 Tax=Fervidobacterium pennivorans TaxID=93466 RepID=A0A7C4RXR0_FERPE
MKRHITISKILMIVLLISISNVVIAGELFEFAYVFLTSRKVPENHAKLMAKALEEESKIVPKSVDPLYILAFGLTETNFMNIFGDQGKAVGYFQIHENAVFYVANFYEDVRQFKEQHRNHAELINYPDWQVKIAYRYIYLTLHYVFDWDLARAISAYNGRLDKYNTYTVKFFNYYAKIISEYVAFLDSKSLNTSK